QRQETLAGMLPPVVRFEPAAPEPPRPLGLGHGLIGYWRFDEAAGSAVAHDRSGHGNDCLLRKLEPASAWPEGQIGGATSLNGEGWLECPRIEALARLHTEMTIAAWVKRTGKSMGVRALVTRQAGSDELDLF